MTTNAVISIKPLGFQWETQNPFLFCVHHEDYYPKGNAQMGPNESLSGRQLGQDFEPKDGWRMYHGRKIPGFPVHPHRGFETVTIVRQGLVDHTDSMGAAGRYGGGDTQWMTAGKGVQHAEMFPLLNQDKENTLELFQIWLNLPKANKMVEPHFTMFWRDAIPQFVARDDTQKETTIDLIAGSLGGLTPLAPPPDSWAADPNNHVVIWTIKMAPGARWTLPGMEPGLNRTLYFFGGAILSLDGQQIKSKHGIELRAELDVVLENGNEECFLLLLQGRPIDEPVVQYGPFVMNTNEEIQQAFSDYRRTQFGGWPWQGSDQVHPRTQERFAKHASGEKEEPGGW